jgi:transposase
MRYQLTDHEWVAIKPMLPNKPRGVGNFLSPSLMRAGTGRPSALKPLKRESRPSSEQGSASASLWRGL